MSYYNDERITFDDADRIVREYVTQYGSRRSHVTAKNVAKRMDVDPRHHNLIRIHEALTEKAEVDRPGGVQATRFRINLD